MEYMKISMIDVVLGVLYLIVLGLWALGGFQSLALIEVASALVTVSFVLYVVNSLRKRSRTVKTKA